MALEIDAQNPYQNGNVQVDPSQLSASAFQGDAQLFVHMKGVHQGIQFEIVRQAHYVAWDENSRTAIVDARMFQNLSLFYVEGMTSTVYIDFDESDNNSEGLHA